MGVTAFRQVENKSDKIIRLNNHEHSSDTVILQPGGRAGIEMWIPWCVNTGDFKYGHFITVDQMSPSYPSYFLPTAVLYAIWQKDNTVCYSTDAQYHDPGAPIPGICAINGDRGLIVNADLSITVILV